MGHRGCHARHRRRLSTRLPGRGRRAACTAIMREPGVSARRSRRRSPANWRTFCAGMEQVARPVPVAYEDAIGVVGSVDMDVAGGGPQGAHLRWFIVTAAQRGKGLGKDTDRAGAVRFSDEAGQAAGLAHHLCRTRCRPCPLRDATASGSSRKSRWTSGRVACASSCLRGSDRDGELKAPVAPRRAAKDDFPYWLAAAATIAVLAARRHCGKRALRAGLRHGRQRHRHHDLRHARRLCAGVGARARHRADGSVGFDRAAADRHASMSRSSAASRSWCCCSGSPLPACRASSRCGT